ncbi:unnamed protein product [Phytomonas sp. Hart1]|nr:unnamed protein product [Phytomonas sp. Hart1]|eukprot:CCW67421.1 unnamed protein product [Phytomonas sp. isolate Hart1]
MANIVELDRMLRTGPLLNEKVLGRWILLSDISNASEYYNADEATTFTAVQNVSNVIVTRYLNSNNKDEVSLHCKTKFCILLNNFALYLPVRRAVFASLQKLTSVFENSITDESKMPFESELGRMSEHVLVLLMRCTDYNLKASAVHEFTEGQTQFAIQLLLAILLKEPPYEFDLRCNCITGIYGFTHPQAFFIPGEDIKENLCTKFTDKLNFILNHMLRLRATQVVSDVLKEAMLVNGTNQTVLRRGVTDMMRSIMNIFKFSTNRSSEWRSHVLNQTTFIQETVSMHTQSLVDTLEKQLVKTPSAVSTDLLKSLHLTIRFCVFATYHHKQAVKIRDSCSFFGVIFALPIQSLLTDPRKSSIVKALYISIFHFMCNMNALDNSVLPENELPLEIQSAELARLLEAFLESEVVGCGLEIVQAWYKLFMENNMECPHETDNVTCNEIDAIFGRILRRLHPFGVSDTASRLQTSSQSDRTATISRTASERASVVGGAKTSLNTSQSGKRNSYSRLRPEGMEPDFCCALTGELMKNPVKSPYGHSFDKEAILRWMNENGSVCPMTGKPLEAAGLVPDTATGARIMQMIVAQSMATEITEEEMYNF